jgi:glucokinase
MFSEIESIGVGCPGMIKSPEGIIKLSPNLSFLENYPLKEKLEAQFKKPVTLENDVNAGIYGEQQFGAAKDFQNVVGVFMGTGIGGGLIINGQLFRGSNGAAGEIGHMFMNLPSFLDTGEKFGTLEDLAGRLRISSEAVLIAMKQKAPALYNAVWC